MKSTHRKKPTNISLPVELVEEARELHINLSRELEAHLAEVVRQRRAERWRRENEKAFEAYAKYFEKHGIWNEDLRGW
ncbi:MAG: type II toxin-antitoxin system CcdA family antitoxin [Myxococcota bacterium]